MRLVAKITGFKFEKKFALRPNAAHFLRALPTKKAGGYQSPRPEIWFLPALILDE